MKCKLLLVLLLSTIISFGKPAKVVRVIDGDTFVIETGERVRVLGINAPEMKTFYGEPAREHLLAMIDGKTLDLEPDHISKDKDVFGRLLRYVILDGVDIDKKMVTDGYAIAFLKYPFDKEEEYRKEEIKAKAADLGIWTDEGKDATAVAKNGNTEKQPSSSISANAFFIGIIAIIIILAFIIVVTQRRK